jgi:hypothetical protein
LTIELDGIQIAFAVALVEWLLPHMGSVLAKTIPSSVVASQHRAAICFRFPSLQMTHPK